MRLPQPIRATIFLVLLLMTFGIHLACQARTKGPAVSNSARSPVEFRAPVAEDRSRPAAETAPPASKTAISSLVTMETAIDRGAVLQGQDGVVHVEVTLRTAGSSSAATRTPTDIVVILDRSGSMSGQKVEYARTATKHLIHRLGVNDRFGVVAYESTGIVLAPIQTATSDNKLSWLQLVDRIDARGSTNMAEGMDLAQDMLQNARLPNRHARVLLLSDGLANTGDHSLAGLTRRARRAIRGEYALSTMGIGSDFDQHLMTQLATAGDGAFYYLAKLEVLAQFFEAEFDTARATVATRARLRFRPAPGTQLVDAMGLPVERVGDAIEVPVGSLYAKHNRTLWLTVKVPSDRNGTRELGALSLDYRNDEGTASLDSRNLPNVDCVASFEAFRRAVKKEVWERAVVEEELSRSQERLGDAIASGNEADVDREVTQANEHRRLAESLGSQKVVAALERLDSSAASARSAQKAAPMERNLAAKRQKTDGYVQRNSSKYVNSNPSMGY